MYNKNTPVTVEYGRIPQGTLDIAKYLRTDPEKTLFYHSTSFDPNDESSRARWAINRGNFLYAQILALTPDTADGTPLSGLCHYDQGLIDYYASVGLLNRNNLLQVGPANKTGWPYNSIQHMLLEQLRTDANLRSRLRGFTLVSSYIGREDMEIADIIGGNVLMEPSAQEPFNSKFYYRRLLEGANIFVMAPGCARRAQPTWKARWTSCEESSMRCSWGYPAHLGHPFLP